MNSDLQDEVQRLQTDDGAREAIREELGHIVNGERRESLQDLPPLPRDLPDGWPYSQVERIVAVRTAAQLAAVAATSTTAAATSTVAATSTAAVTSTAAAVTSTTAAATGAAAVTVATSPTAVVTTSTAPAATSTTAPT